MHCSGQWWARVACHSRDAQAAPILRREDYGDLLWTGSRTMHSSARRRPSLRCALAGSQLPAAQLTGKKRANPMSYVSGPPLGKIHQVRGFSARYNYLGGHFSVKYLVETGTRSWPHILHLKAHTRVFRFALNVGFHGIFSHAQMRADRVDETSMFRSYTSRWGGDVAVEPRSAVVDYHWYADGKYLKSGDRSLALDRSLRLRRAHAYFNSSIAFTWWALWLAAACMDV
jgi:hypothetical protein